MRSFLYVYYVKNLKLFIEEYEGFDFYSIAYFIHTYDTVEKLQEHDGLDLSKVIIDISNLIKDGNYFRIFTERYIRVLSENFDDVHFCLQADLFEVFIERFPYLFDQENINDEFSPVEGTEQDIINDLKISSPVNLYLLKNVSVARELSQQNKLVPLSMLIDECMGIVFKYDIDKIATLIETKNISYIDISSIIKTIKIRGDLIFFFEALIYRIFRNVEIRYCVEKGLASEVLSFFPFLFSKQVDINDCENEEDDENGTSNAVNIEEVNQITEAIGETLRGHADFKKGFKKSLLKFRFLNKMGERKILSILLCGDSGIGKTEFARIASSKMFPKEPLIKINFGNYSTEGVLNSLIGSPLGYVGSEEGGELINKIGLSKSHIILIDEFERATPSVFNFFYELLEEGAFTDRHGNAHNLNNYIIIFTSNMTQAQYKNHIPNALKSRFDMVYYFVDLTSEEKITYITDTANDLINKLEVQFGEHVSVEALQPQLDKLISNKNLRDIKRGVEDIVFDDFFKLYYK